MSNCYDFGDNFVVHFNHVNDNNHNSYVNNNLLPPNVNKNTKKHSYGEHKIDLNTYYATSNGHFYRGSFGCYDTSINPLDAR